MDTLIQDFNLLGLASLAVMIVVVVGLTRRMITFFVPSFVPLKMADVAAKTYAVKYSSSAAQFYNEIGVYLMPYAWAAIFALVKSSFIFGKVDTYSGRLFLSFFIATFSATIFRAVKKSLPKPLGVEVKENDTVFEQLEEKPADPKPPQE